ncbi:MAG: type IV secretory system conjugative DNA transfer family protein [Acidimicrobiales bacterium]
MANVSRATSFGPRNPMPSHASALAAPIPIAEDEMELVLPALLRLGGYTPDPPDAGHSGVAAGSRTRSRDYGGRGTARETVVCRWVEGEDPGSTLLAWVVRDADNRPLEDETALLGGAPLAAAVQGYLARSKGWAPPRDPIIPPGQSLDGPWVGQLLDLAGMATNEELCDHAEMHTLADGVLPLGRYAWGYPEARFSEAFYRAGTTYGPPLYMGHYGEEPMEFRGTIICAPPGAGKTELILRWAVAALANGYSLLLVDVKGVLRAELQRRLAAAGVGLPTRSFYFSTNPTPRHVSDRVNFLGGLTGETAEGREQLEQLARAILPSEGFESGEELRFYRLRLGYLTAMLGLVKLRESYGPHPERRAYDLGDVCDVASRESTLRAYIDAVVAAEAACDTGTAQEPGLAHWFDELAILVCCRDHWTVHGATLCGQRADRDTYRYHTQSIVEALRPFASKGVLGRRVSGHRSRAGEGYSFSVDELLREEQTFILLEARELDVGSADAVVSLFVTHLQLTLNRRHGQRDARPILLLLDETARIRGFDAKKYVALCRSAQAAVVLVYQQLDQISRTPDRGSQQVTELIENVGTQIFLGSLVGRSHELLAQQLGRRWRSSVSRTAGPHSTGREQQITQEETESIPAFSRLPAGRFPALVYIRDHPANKPFLVDMDRSHFELRVADPDATRHRRKVAGLDLPPAVKAHLASSPRSQSRPPDRTSSR